MSDQASDEQVIERLGQGDDSALAELMRRWEGRLWCFIDRMCSRLHCTDDIYQEVWTRVYISARRFRPGLPFRPYLFTIAINRCRTALNRSLPRLTRERPGAFGDAPDDDCPGAMPAPPHETRTVSFRNADGMGMPLATEEPGPAEALLADEQSAQLHEAISRLPGAQRAVVLLYLLFDTNYRRIAAVLGKSEGTVRSHMHHALGKLRAILGWMTAERQWSQSEKKSG